MDIHVSSGNVRYGMVANVTAWHSVSCWSTVNLNNASLSFWWKTVLLCLVCLFVWPFSLPYFSSNTTLVKMSGKGVEGGTREGNGSDVYKEQTYLVLAIQAVNPGLLVPIYLGWLLELPAPNKSVLYRHRSHFLSHNTLNPFPRHFYQRYIWGQIW